MKKILLFILMGMFLYTGCQSESVPEMQKKNVKVTETTIKKCPRTLEYIGIIDSMDVRTPAFKTGGKIEKIFVKTGQYVKKGDQLIRINADDLIKNVEITRAQFEIAQAQYVKARDTFDKYEKLLEVGAISSQQLQDFKLQTEIFESQRDIAAAQYQQNQDLLENCVLRSEIDGFVQQIMAKEGDYAAQGLPVIAVKGDKSAAKIGVTNEDLSKISVGTAAVVRYQNCQIKGKVETIAYIPGNLSTLYEVQVNLEPNDIPIGTLVDVTFILGEIQGLFVPLNCLLHESFDYVLIVQDEKAVIKQVDLGEVVGNEIQINAGIAPGDKVIAEGMRSVKNNDPVDIKE